MQINAAFRDFVSIGAVKFPDYDHLGPTIY